MPCPCACGCGNRVASKDTYRASCAKREGIANRDPKGYLKRAQTLDKGNRRKRSAKNNAKNNAKYNALTKQKKQEMRKRKRVQSGNEVAEPTMSASEIEEVRVKLVEPLIDEIRAIAATIIFGISSMSNGFDRVREHYPLKVP
jgi:hypothetical protein